MKKLFTSTYDLSGLSIIRLFKFMCYSKIFPFGNFGTGAGAKCLLVLSVLHTFGGPVFTFYTRYEEKLSPLIKKIPRRGKNGNIIGGD